MVKERKYTLEDKPFRVGLIEGSCSEAYLSGNSKLMLVGGGATQLFLRGEPYVLRPTTDVDFIANRATKKSERRAWAKELAPQISSLGYRSTGGLSRHGAAVMFDDLSPDFGVHLDTFGENFYRRHERRFCEEFEMAEIGELEGKKIRYQSPRDMILNKLRRMTTLINMNNINLDSYQKGLIGALMNGDLDSVDTTGLAIGLSQLDRIRNQNLEELEKQGYQGIIRQVSAYKVMKDLSDVKHIIDQCRKKEIQIDQRDFLRGLDLVLAS